MGRRFGNMLMDYCEANELLMGDFAVANLMDYRSYFARYGLGVDAFTRVYERDLRFQGLFPGQNDDLMYPKDAMNIYSQEFGVALRWCPKFIHVYEAIKCKFRNFDWIVDVEKEMVSFSNYPTIRECVDGQALLRYPSLYELLRDHFEIDPDYDSRTNKRKRSGGSAIGWRRRRAAAG